MAFDDRVNLSLKARGHDEALRLVELGARESRVKNLRSLTPVRAHTIEDLLRCRFLYVKAFTGADKTDECNMQKTAQSVC